MCMSARKSGGAYALEIESCTERWWLTVRSIGYAVPVSTSSHAKVVEARSSIADYRHPPFLRRRLSRSLSPLPSPFAAARARKREGKSGRAHSLHTCVRACARARAWTSVMSIFSPFSSFPPHHFSGHEWVHVATFHLAYLSKCALASVASTWRRDER